MGIHFAQFVKGDPKNTRYRIEVSMKKRMTQERIDMYEESGWDYVTSYHYFHVFSSPVELDAPELHTDPAEQSYTLKELDKKLAMNASIVAIGMLIMVGMIVAIWFLDGTPTLVLVEGVAIQQTFLTLFIGYTAYTSLQASISIRALRKALIEGKPIDHHAPWKKHHRLKTMLAFLFTVVIGLSTSIPFVQITKMDTKTLPEASLDLPIVRLADVEQNPSLVRGETSYMSDNVDWSNRYTYEWSPLAPIQYEADETGVIPGKMWEDASGEYSPSIHTTFFQLSVPAMTDNLIYDLVKRYQYENRREDFVQTNHPDFDLLIVHEKEDMKEVFASKGKAVIYVQYYGYAEINSVIEGIEAKIDITSGK